MSSALDTSEGSESLPLCRNLRVGTPAASPRCPPVTAPPCRCAKGQPILKGAVPVLKGEARGSGKHGLPGFPDGRVLDATRTQCSLKG